MTSFATLNFLGGGDSNLSVLLCFALLVEAVLGGMQNALIEGLCQAAVGDAMTWTRRSQATRDLPEGATPENPYDRCTQANRRDSST